MYFKFFVKHLIYSGLNFLSFFIPKKNCSILMYHSISDNKVLYVVKPKDFQWQMEYLKKNNFNVISLADLVDFLKNKKEIPHKTIVLTFDDGYEDNYLIAFPILKKYNFPATIFLGTGYVGDYYPSKFQKILFKMLNWQQIQKMHNSGLIEFGAHCVNHLKLAKIPIKQAEKEIMDSKKIIEEKLNKKCRFFSYPHGHYNQEIIEILRKNDFEAAVNVEKGFIRPGDELMELKRNFVYLYCGKAEFKGISGESFMVITSEALRRTKSFWR